LLLLLADEVDDDIRIRVSIINGRTGFLEKISFGSMYCLPAVIKKEIIF
jgi:hypothetical protein